MSRSTLILDDIKSLADRAKRWSDRTHERLLDQIAKHDERVLKAAKLRVPVETDQLRPSLVRAEYELPDGRIIGEVGTNDHDLVERARYTEFGTSKIAGGAVAAIGPRMDVTDEDAVKDWPAKANPDAGGHREQMPWLRPAVNAVAKQFTDRLPWIGSIPGRQ